MRYPTGGMVWVNVYEAGRAFGGREEGGWWYDYGIPVKEYANVTYREHPMYGRVIDTYDEREVSFRVPRRIAHKVAEKLRNKYPLTGKRGSVNGGEDYSVFVEDHPPQAYPQRRPRYE